MTTTQASPDLAVHRPTRIAVALVMIQDEKVLLQRQAKDAEAYPSMWDLPCLPVPAGQTPEDALQAAAEEVLGIQVEGFHLVAALDDLVGEECWRRFVYRVTGFAGDLRASELRRWYARKEFADVFQLNPIVAALPVFEL